MDLYSFAPVAAVLDAAYTALSALIDAISPLAGGASAAVAIVLVTLLIRGVLIPVGVSQGRAEVMRRRLAPRLREVQARYRSNPELLQRKIAELYAAEKASPLAGCLPLLFQAPVLSAVYAVFVLPNINGHTNLLLGQQLFGVPLGHSLAGVLVSATPWPAATVFVVLLAVVAVVAFLSRRAAVRQAVGIQNVATGVPNAAAGPNVVAVLSWLPFVSVIVAGVVPLAACLYLTVSTTWSLVERGIIRRELDGRPNPVRPRT